MRFLRIPQPNQPLTTTISSLSTTDGDTAIRLFDERLITDTISDSGKRNEVAKGHHRSPCASSLMKTIFSQGFDFSRLSLST